jgi:hypothetical protein
MTRNVRENRSQPKMVAKLLNNALAKDDTIAFVKAIGDVDPCSGHDKDFPGDRTRPQMNRPGFAGGRLV